MTIAIWAPHADDEIIGCYHVLMSKEKVQVYYGGMIEDGCKRASRLFGFEFHHLGNLAHPWDVVYAPDPNVDMHPEHQRIGGLAQQLFRAGKIRRVIHYCTTMQASYIFEVLDPEAKRSALDQCYPEKADLWRYEWKYVLFEGYNEILRLDHRT
jgi:LmbE family N-acetylglucosaminyl deacetylase